MDQEATRYPEALIEKARQVGELLRQEYGIPGPRECLPPLDELVLTILSQHTSDVNSGRAFEGLRASFATWEEVRDAPLGEIADSIRSGGLAGIKALRIKGLLERVSAEHGSLNLNFLHEMDLKAARDYLLGIGGVGPKTAACVLLFACGKPAFPVDTHIHRVSRRLGLIDSRTSADEAHDILEDLVPDEETYSYHVNLITHGRRVCKAPRPLCESCVLAPLCDFFQATSPSRE